MDFSSDNDEPYSDDNEKLGLGESSVPRSGRSSILKPPKVRGPLQDVNLIPNNVSVDIDRKKRVSFAGVNKVREFNSKAGTFHVSNTPSYDEIFSTSSDSSEMSLSESCRNKIKDATVEDEAMAIIDSISNDDSSSGMDITNCSANDSFSSKVDADTSRRGELFDVEPDEVNSHHIKCSEVDNPMGNHNFNPFLYNSVTSNQNISNNLQQSAPEKSMIETKKKSSFNIFPLDQENVVIDKQLPPLISGSKYPEIEQMRNSFIFGDGKLMGQAGNYIKEFPQTKLVNNENENEMDITQYVSHDKSSPYEADMSLESNEIPQKLVRYPRNRELFFHNADLSKESNFKSQETAVNINKFAQKNLPNINVENDMDITENIISDKAQHFVGGFVEEMSLEFSITQQKPNINKVSDINHKKLIAINPTGNLNMMSKDQKSNDYKVENKKPSHDTKDNLIRPISESNTANPNVKLTSDSSTVGGFLNFEEILAKGSNEHPEFNNSTDMEFTEAIHMVVKSNENKSFERKKSFPLKFNNLNNSSDMEITEACALGHRDKTLFNHEVFKNLLSSDNVTEKISKETCDMKTSNKSKLLLYTDLQNNEFLDKENSKDQRNELNICSKKGFPENLKLELFKGTSSNMESLSAKPLENNDCMEDSSEMELTKPCFKDIEVLNLSDRGNTSNMEFTEVLPTKQAFMDEVRVWMNVPPASDMSADMEFTEAINVPIKCKINDQLSNCSRGNNYPPDKSDNKFMDGDQFKKSSSQMEFTVAVGLNNSNKLNNTLAKGSQIKEKSKIEAGGEAYYADKNENNTEQNLEAYLFKPFDMPNILLNKESDSNKYQSNMDITEIKSPAKEIYPSGMKCPKIVSESNFISKFQHVLKDEENMNISSHREQFSSNMELTEAYGIKSLEKTKNFSSHREQFSSNMELTEAYGIKSLEKTKNLSCFNNSSNMELTEAVKLKGDIEIKSNGNLLKNNIEFAKQNCDVSSGSGIKNSKNEEMDISASLNKVNNSYNEEVSVVKSVKQSRQSTTIHALGRMSSNFPVQKDEDVAEDINDDNNHSKPLIIAPALDVDNMELTEVIDDLSLEKLQETDVKKVESINKEDESADSGSMDLTQCCSKISFTDNKSCSKTQFSVFVDDKEEINNSKICKEKSVEVTMALNSSELSEKQQNDKTFHISSVNLDEVNEVKSQPKLQLNSGLNKADYKVNDDFENHNNLQHSESFENSKIPVDSLYSGSYIIPKIAATKKDNFISEQNEIIQNQIDDELKSKNSYQSPTVFIRTEEESNSLNQVSNTNVDQNQPKEKEMSQENNLSCNTSMDITKLIPNEDESTKNSEDERLIQSCNTLKIDDGKRMNSESLNCSFNNMKLTKNDSTNANTLIPSKIPKLISKPSAKSINDSEIFISNESLGRTNLINLSIKKQTKASESLNQIRPNIINAVGPQVHSKFNAKKISTSTIHNQDSLHFGSESVVVMKASSIFNTTQRTINQDLEHRRHLEEYKCNVQNLKFMKSLSFDRISYTEWRYSLTKTLYIIIEVPKGAIDERTNLNVVQYKLNNNSSDPLNLYVAEIIKSKYPEDWLKSKCQTVKDVTRAAAIIEELKTEMEKCYEAVFYLYRFYPCKLIENNISFYIVDIKAGIKFDVIISLNEFKKITSKDIKVINHFGNVREQFIRSMFASITDDKKRLLNFVRHLEDYCKTQRPTESQSSS